MRQLQLAIDIDAVVLDMDGLMLDTEPVYRRAWQEAALQFGFLLDGSFYLTLIGRTNASAELALAERFGRRPCQEVYRSFVQGLVFLP